MNDDKSYIYGRNAILEALAADKEIEKIFILFGTEGHQINSIIIKARQNKIPVSQSDKSKFLQLERSVVPRDGKAQGVIALLRGFTLFTLDDLIKLAYKKDKNPVIALLDGIVDPHNLGAIARSAECAGAAGIIITGRDSAPITPVAVKTSAGALEHLPIVKISSTAQTLDKLKETGFWVVGSDSDGDKLYDEKIYDAPIVVVVGSEGKGMHPATRKHCDIIVRIPLYGRITSLNASVAAALMLFEIARQRRM